MEDKINKVNLEIGQTLYYIKDSYYVGEACVLGIDCSNQGYTRLILGSYTDIENYLPKYIKSEYKVSTKEVNEKQCFYGVVFGTNDGRWFHKNKNLLIKTLINNIDQKIKSLKNLKDQYLSN